MKSEFSCISFSTIKSFFDFLGVDPCDVRISENFVGFDLPYDLCTIERLNILHLSFADRSDFDYCPDINIFIKDNVRTVRFFYHIDRIVEYVTLKLK